MAKPRLAAIDTLDDRRELMAALHSLPPLARVCAVAAVSSTAAGFGGRGVRVGVSTFRKALAADRSADASTALTIELKRDLCLLVSNYGLDAVAVAVAVEGYARRPHTVPPWHLFVSAADLFGDADAPRPSPG